MSSQQEIKCPRVNARGHVDNDSASFRYSCKPRVPGTVVYIMPTHLGKEKGTNKRNTECAPHAYLEQMEQPHSSS